jgi:hypothetical protein
MLFVAVYKEMVDFHFDNTKYGDNGLQPMPETWECDVA